MHLADLGLLEEARWALEHSLAIENDPKTADSLGSSPAAIRPTRSGRTVARQGPESGQRSLAICASPIESQTAEPAVRRPGLSQWSRDSRSSDRRTVSTRVCVNLSVGDSVSREPRARFKPRRPARRRRQNRFHVAKTIPLRPIGSPVEEAEKPGMLRRFFSSFKRVW